MSANEYQQKAWDLAFFTGKYTGDVTYPALGLAGETGEVCDKIKKVIRDDNGLFSEETRAGLKLELGDVLWYLAAICSTLDFTLEDVMEANIAKLTDRASRGTQRGSGDCR